VSNHFSFTLLLPRYAREIRTPASISQPFDLAHLRPGIYPEFHSFEAIWDTGATATVVSERVVDLCKLQPTGMTRVRTTIGSADCEVYLVNLNLLNKVFFPSIHVTKAELGPKFDVLIGMDIIRGSDFALSTQGEQICFSFRHPSSGPIDLAAMP
jgi:hypothetical protein